VERTSVTIQNGFQSALTDIGDVAGFSAKPLADFRDLPFAAVGQALSRLTRQGSLERLSKGVYYSIGETSPTSSTSYHVADSRFCWR